MTLYDLNALDRRNEDRHDQIMYDLKRKYQWLVFLITANTSLIILTILSIAP